MNEYIDLTEKIDGYNYGDPIEIRPPVVSSPMWYIGAIDNLVPPINGEGSICTYHGTEYIYAGGIWEKLYSETPTPTEPQYEYLTRCLSCGAPTDHYGKCPYCGTINRKLLRN